MRIAAATTALAVAGAEPAALAAAPAAGAAAGDAGVPVESVLQGELLERGRRRAEHGPTHRRTSPPPGWVHETAVARAARVAPPPVARAPIGLDLYRAVAAPASARGRRVDAVA